MEVLLDMDVEHHRINGDGVAKPDRVLPLLGNVPAVFKPFLEIISGTQVRELKWEKVVLDEGVITGGATPLLIYSDQPKVAGV